MKRILLILSLLFSLTALQAQEHEGTPFNGQIVDIAKNPMKKVRVWVNDNQKDYAMTNKRGQFGFLNVQPGDTLKLFYKKKLYTVPVSGKRSIRIHFWGDLSSVTTEEAAELVDLGYGLIQERTNTTSSDRMTGEELEKTGCVDLLDALMGRIPGLFIQPSTMGIEAEAKVHGISSLNGGSAPLYVVDGSVVKSLTGYNVYQVDYVEVLKDASIYGARGAGGAIIVKTKGTM